MLLVCPNDPSSIAVSIILFPLIMDVVQMIICIRAVHMYEYSKTKQLNQRTFFLLCDKPQCCDFGERYASQYHNKNCLSLTTPTKKRSGFDCLVLSFLELVKRRSSNMLHCFVEAAPPLRG